MDGGHGWNGCHAGTYRETSPTSIDLTASREPTRTQSLHVQDAREARASSSWLLVTVSTAVSISIQFIPWPETVTDPYLYLAGPSRCFPFWQDVLACYVVNTSAEDDSGKKKCAPALEDYYECLHHKKEVRLLRNAWPQRTER